MKPLEKIYSEIVSSEELKQEFMGLTSPEEVVEFVKKLGGDASAEEVGAFLTSRQTESGELSDEDMKQVSGGKKGDAPNSYWNTYKLAKPCSDDILW